MNTKNLLTLVGAFTLLFCIAKKFSLVGEPVKAAIEAPHTLLPLNATPKQEKPTLSIEILDLSRTGEIKSTSEKNALAIENERVWSTPIASLFWDQIPQHKNLIDYFKKLQSKTFSPTEEPKFIGQDEQGLDVYEFKTSEGANATQWLRSGKIVFERAIFKNGDTLRRWSPDSEVPFYSISFQSRGSENSQRIDFRTSGSVASVWFEQNGTSTIYDYNEQGRLLNVVKRKAALLQSK